MSTLNSVVERAMNLQLQHIAPFRDRPSIPLLTALVAFSGFSIVAHGSSLFALATNLRNTLAKLSTSEGVLLWNSLVCSFARALVTATCLRARIHAKNDDTYVTPRAEERYWRVAGRYRRRLYSGNEASRDATHVPLVTYYTPRLLPLYRNQSVGKRVSGKANADIREGRISPKAFCKWHRMVYQDSCHPTLAQAVVQMKHYSKHDLREIQRIARMLPDEQVFGTKGKKAREIKGTTRYSEIWKSWLANKGIDVVIVFE